MCSLMCFGKYYHIKLAKHPKSGWQDVRVNINVTRQSELSTIREKQISMVVIKSTENPDWKGSWLRENTEAEASY